MVDLGTVAHPEKAIRTAIPTINDLMETMESLNNSDKSPFFLLYDNTPPPTVSILFDAKIPALLEKAGQKKGLTFVPIVISTT